jgi:tRNA(fMet)-specific endonuclease VapC
MSRVTCIYLIHRRPPSVIQAITRLEPNQVKVSAVSLAELEYGASKSRSREKNRIALLRFAAAFDIVPFDDRDAEVYGLIRAGLERRGQPIGSYDLQIAAQAVTRDLVLVTNNVDEFQRVPDLRIQNWVR